MSLEAENSMARAGVEVTYQGLDFEVQSRESGAEAGESCRAEITVECGERGPDPVGNGKPWEVSARREGPGQVCQFDTDR